MVAGLPLDAWILVIGSVGLGLVVELLFLRAQRGREPADGATEPS